MENRLHPLAIINLMDVFGWVIDALSDAIIKYDESISFDMEAPE